MTPTETELVHEGTPAKPGTRRRPGKIVRELLRVVLSLSAAVLAAEACFRAREYFGLVRGIGIHNLWVVMAPLYQFDRAEGFRYRPNTNINLQFAGSDDKLEVANRIRVNNSGHVSTSDDTISKPVGQFRIAIIGSSFAASINQDLPWPSLLEQELNADVALRRAVGASSFKVLNFGRDGTGFTQWESVYAHEVRPYRPDLVVVDFVSDDLRRRFVWRDMLPLHVGKHNVQALVVCTSLPVLLSNRDCTFGTTLAINASLPGSSAALAEVRSALDQMQAKRLNWLTPHSEILASLLRKPSTIATELQAARTLPRFPNDEAAVDASAAALCRLMAAQPRVLVVHTPDYSELAAGGAPDPITPLFSQRVGFEVISMMTFLPPTMSGSEVNRRFNLRYDGHFSDYGAARYADAMHAMLRGRIP